MNVNAQNPLNEDIENGVRAEYHPVSDDKRVEFFALRPLQDIQDASVTINLTNNHRSQNRELRDVGLTLRVEEIDGFVEALIRAKVFAEGNQHESA